MMRLLSRYIGTMTGVFGFSAKDLIPFTRACVELVEIGDVRKERKFLVSARNLPTATSEAVYSFLSFRLLRQNFFVSNLAMTGTFSVSTRNLLDVILVYHEIDE